MRKQVAESHSAHHIFCLFAIIFVHLCLLRLYTHLPFWNCLYGTLFFPLIYLGWFFLFLHKTLHSSLLPFILLFTCDSSASLLCKPDRFSTCEIVGSWFWLQWHLYLLNNLQCSFSIEHSLRTLILRSWEYWNRFICNTYTRAIQKFQTLLNCTLHFHQILPSLVTSARPTWPRIPIIFTIALMKDDSWLCNVIFIKNSNAFSSNGWTTLSHLSAHQDAAHLRRSESLMPFIIQCFISPTRCCKLTCLCRIPP